MPYGNCNEGQALLQVGAEILNKHHQPWNLTLLTCAPPNTRNRVEDTKANSNPCNSEISINSFLVVMFLCSMVKIQPLELPSYGVRVVAKYILYSSCSGGGQI